MENNRGTQLAANLAVQKVEVPNADLHVEKGQDALHDGRRQVLRPQGRGVLHAAALQPRQAQRSSAQALGTYREEAANHLARLLVRAGQGGGQDGAQGGRAGGGDQRPLGVRQGQVAGDAVGEQLSGQVGVGSAQVCNPMSALARTSAPAASSACTAAAAASAFELRAATCSGSFP